MTTVQPIPGVPGMTGVAVPGMPGMTPVQVAGVSRVPNGMSSMYQSEKSAALYPGANPSYQSLAQPSFLAQSGSLGQAGSLGQPGAAFYGTCNQHPTYLPVTSPSTQQRYMVSAGYPGAGSLVSSPSMVPGKYNYLFFCSVNEVKLKLFMNVKCNTDVFGEYDQLSRKLNATYVLDHSGLLTNLLITAD